MTKDEKVCVTTPWWDEPHEGVITKKFHTPIENYYVIEFPDGEVITMKESEIPKVPKDQIEETIRLFMGTSLKPATIYGLVRGYLFGKWEDDKITAGEYYRRLSKWEKKYESCENH